MTETDQVSSAGQHTEPMAHLTYYLVCAEQFFYVVGALDPARARAPSDADTPDFHIMAA